MRVVVPAVVACALALAGCRSDEELAPPDLSAPGLYCPADPPADTSFICDFEAIPYCTYPALGITCKCVQFSDLHHLVCGPEVGPDEGLPTGTGT